MNKRYAIGEIPHLKICGRMAEKDGACTFFWTGSGIELQVTGSELWIETEVPEDVLPPWICVYLNGHMLSRQILPNGRHTVCVYTGLNDKAAKSVKLIKESPAMFDGYGCSFSVSGIILDGCFEPIREKKYRLEIIGDSITSGEGLYGTPDNREWDLWFFTAMPEYHYGMQAAKQLDADIRMVAQSGWGILTGYDNCPFHNIPSVYEKICGVQSEESARAAGAWEPYDFDKWQPDVVLIHLGTNDAAAFRNPAWRNPADGQAYQMRLEKDGTFAGEDTEKIERAAFDFLKKVRRNNPEAVILWIYGMMKNELEDTLRQAVKRYREEWKDQKVGYLALPDTKTGEFGGVDHPGRESHQRAAQIICEEVRRWLQR